MTPLGERGGVERGLALVKHHRGHLDPFSWAISAASTPYIPSTVLALAAAQARCAANTVMLIDEFLYDVGKTNSGSMFVRAAAPRLRISVRHPACIARPHASLWPLTLGVWSAVTHVECSRGPRV